MGALPVGRGQIGRVKYLAVGRAKPGQGRGGGQGPHIPPSVIKTGVKLPQLQPPPGHHAADKPYLVQMKQELDQIAPTISNNPFMKNDKRKKAPDVDTAVAQAAFENEIENSPATMEDKIHEMQKNDLKRELNNVLKGIRRKDDNEVIDQYADAETGEGDTSDIEDDESSSLGSCSSSDITIDCDESHEANDDVTKITENEEEEISAL